MAGVPRQDDVEDVIPASAGGRNELTSTEMDLPTSADVQGALADVR